MVDTSVLIDSICDLYSTSHPHPQLNDAEKKELIIFTRQIFLSVSIPKRAYTVAQDISGDEQGSAVRGSQNGAYGDHFRSGTGGRNGASSPGPAPRAGETAVIYLYTCIASGDGELNS